MSGKFGHGKSEKKKIGGRSYQGYNRKYLESACAAVRKGESIRRASEMYAVPRSTIQDHLKKRPEKKDSKPGRRTVFTDEEERILTAGILRCCDWGVSLPKRSICDIIEAFINNRGANEVRFRNNRPGKDWMKAFLSRHPILRVRIAANIKRSRASVTRETIDSYFHELKGSLEGVSPECILNYDETNFVDDPGQKEVRVDHRYAVGSYA